MDLEKDKLISGAVLFLFGATVTQIWNKYRTRLSNVSWTSTTSRLATSGDDARYGKVEVLYNGMQASNLHLLTVAMHNDSSTDLKDVTIGLAFRDGTTILFSEGALVSSLQEFAMEENFISSWQSALEAKLSSDQLRYFWTHRFYRIPVLNRQSAARFGFLVSREDFAEPMLLVSCDHVGLRLRNRPPEELFWGESKARSALIGFGVALAATLVVVAFASLPAWLTAVLGWLLGGLCTIWGAAVLKATRFLGRIFG